MKTRYFIFERYDNIILGEGVLRSGKITKSVQDRAQKLAEAQGLSIFEISIVSISDSLLENYNYIVKSDGGPKRYNQHATKIA